jgi:TonB-dependent receptor
MARHGLDWSVGVARVVRNEPDRSDLAYEARRDPLSGAVVPARWWGAPRSATRTFSRLGETSRDLQVSVRLVSSSAPYPSALKLGGAFRATRREADSRAYDLWDLSLDDTQRAAPAEEIFDGAYAAQGRLGLFESAIGGQYTATETVAAGFGQVETRVAGARVVAGLRVERAQLEVRSLSPNGQPATGTLDNVDLLPGLSLTVPVAPSHDLKLAFGNTVARPEYRELSPVSYFEVLGGATVFGNPGLRRTVVHNADLRWEWFPQADEVVSLGLFAKRFTDPIELILVATTGGLVRTYVNAPSAYTYGLEAEVRRSLGGRLAPLSLFGNLTIVRSRIVPGNDSISALTSRDRAMVGQAAYVVNAGIGYSRPASDLSATILYNLVGPRIAEAGVYPMPDSYEQPRHVVDAALRVPLARTIALKLDARNLLDAPYRTTQGGLVRHAYSTGRTLTVGLRWSPRIHEVTSARTRS